MKPLARFVPRTHKNIFSSRSGNYLLARKGSGFDFRSLGEYVVGSDAKNIDWKSTAKLQKPYVKEYMEERELLVQIVALRTPSLEFGSSRLKSEVLDEAVGILRSTLTHHHFRFEILDSLPQANSGKSYLIVIGDFFGSFDFAQLGVHHEIVVLVIRDSFELEPVPLGFIALKDATTGERLELDFDAQTARAYHERVALNDAEFFAMCGRNRIQTTTLRTDEEVSSKLARFFS